MNDKATDKRPPFFMVEDAVLDYKLTPYEGWLYIVIVKHADRKTGEAFPSIKTLASITGMSRASVIRATKSLEAKGLISVTRDANATGKDREVNHYFVLAATPVSHSNRGSISQTLPPVSQVDMNKSQFEQEKDSAPQNGAGASPTKQAKPNPLYDAVEAVWGYTAARNGSYGKMLTGVATSKAHKPCNVEPAMTPDEIREWGAWWKSNNPTMTMLAAPEKVQSSIYEWRKLKANPKPRVTELYERPTPEEIEAATSVYGARKYDKNGMYIGVMSEKDANPVWTPSHLR